MRSVIITSGTYGYKPDGAKHVMPKSRADGPISLPDAEADRLVKLGVAEYVDDIAPEMDASAVATGAGGEDDGEAGGNTPDDDDGSEGEESAHLDPEQLKDMTNAKLRELAEDMGIDTGKLKTKAQLIAAITDIPLEDAISDDDEGVDDGEAPPALESAAPMA